MDLVGGYQPEFYGSIFTSLEPLTNAERVGLWNLRKSHPRDYPPRLVCTAGSEEPRTQGFARCGGSEVQAGRFLQAAPTTPSTSPSLTAGKGCARRRWVVGGSQSCPEDVQA